jgi:hypothetical protein
MQAVYDEGIPYISREEEAVAIAKTLERNQRIVRSKIDIQESDHESMEFLDGVRRDIDAWLSDEKVEISLLSGISDSLEYIGHRRLSQYPASSKPK